MIKKTYVEFGIKGKTLRKVFGEDAYNLWHIAVRTKEKIMISELINKNQYKNNTIPRHEKFLLSYLFLVISKKNNLLELGSSTMEIMDGINYFKLFFSKIFPKYSNLLIKKNINFVGVEKFKYFNILAKHFFNSLKKTIYKNNNLKLYENINEIQKLKLKNYFFHDIGVSNYVFKSSSEFCKFLKKTDSGYLKINFSNSKKDFKYMLAGGEATVFSLENCNKKLKNKLNLIIKSPLDNVPKKDTNNKKKQVLSGYFYYGRDDKLIKFKGLIDKIKNISSLKKIVKKIEC